MRKNFSRHVHPFQMTSQIRPARATGGSEPQVGEGAARHILRMDVPQTALRIYAASPYKLPDNASGKDDQIENIYHPAAPTPQKRGVLSPLIAYLFGEK